MTRAKITLKANGTGTVLVGDHDISNAVSQITLTADPWRSCDATVQLSRVELEADAGVKVDDRTRDALLALGWTEPADESTQWGYAFVDSPTAVVGPVSELHARRTVDGDYSAVLHRRDLVDGIPGLWKAVETR